jgi:hypothetical protein
MLDRSRLDVHTVEHLAELLGAPDGVTRRHEDEPVAAVVERLAARYGKRMAARSKSRHR